MEIKSPFFWDKAGNYLAVCILLLVVIGQLGSRMGTFVLFFCCFVTGAKYLTGRNHPQYKHEQTNIRIKKITADLIFLLIFVFLFTVRIVFGI